MPERPAEVTAEVLGRGSIYTLGTAAPVLAQLAVTPFVARLVTETTGYGQVAVALVVMVLLSFLAMAYGFQRTLTVDEREQVIDFARQFEECDSSREELAAQDDVDLVHSAYSAMAECAKGLR